jgi:hypothetical protein
MTHIIKKNTNIVLKRRASFKRKRILNEEITFNLLKRANGMGKRAASSPLS